MPALQDKHSYTTEYIYSLPAGQRAELIDGQIYDMAPPSRLHQEIVGELFASIKDYIKSNNGICKPYVAPFAVFLNKNDKTYVEPDISVICDTNKLSDRGCEGAPDWIIEVVSPSSRRTDCHIKLFKYRSCGVREYWIVEPEKKRVTVYNFESEDTIEYSFMDNIPSGIYDDLSIDLSHISI